MGMKLLTVAVMVLSYAGPLPAQLAKALDLNTKGNEASETGRMDEAIADYRQALTIWRDAGSNYEAHQAGTLLNLAIAISATGDRREAARIMEQPLVLHRKTLGVHSLRTVSNINLLASNLLMIGQIDH